MHKCPHCNRRFVRLVTHEEICPQRPEVARAVLSTMIDTSAPAYAKRRADYDARRADWLPCGRYLCEHFGSWRKACAWYGLRAKDARGDNGNRPASGLDAPLSDAERHACARRGSVEFGGEQGLHSGWRVADVW